MPPLAIVLALVSALIHASWNALLKRGRDRLADAFLVAVGCAGVGLILIVFVGAPNAAAWPYLIASLVVHALYWTCVIKGYDAGDLSHVYTLSRGLAPAIVAVGAAFAAHEIPALGDGIGIALVCAGVLAVGVSAHAPLRASLWGVLTALTIAAYSLIDALGARAVQSALVYIAWVTLFTGLPLGLFALAKRGLRIFADMRRDLFRGLFAGVVSSAGFGLVLYAQTFAPIAQVTALRETSILFAALIAWLVLKERMDLRRWIGAGVAAAGAILIGFI